MLMLVSTMAVTEKLCFKFITNFIQLRISSLQQ